MEKDRRNQEAGSKTEKIKKINEALDTKEGRIKLAIEMATVIRKHLELCACIGVTPENLVKVCEAYDMEPCLSNYLHISKNRK